MKQRHQQIPQFELPATEDAFNLAGETTEDGDRIKRDTEQREREQEAQKKLQPLFDLDA